MTNLTNHDLQKLARSYITPALAEAARIARVDSLEGAALVGRRASNGQDFSGLTFPYVWPGEQHVHLTRLRRDKPDFEAQPDGTTKERNKYLSPPGSFGRGTFYFPPDTPAGWLRDTSIPITFTEGEKKALALSRFYCERGEQRLVISIPGVWNWRGTIGIERDSNGHGVGNVKGPIPDFDRVAWQGREVLIVFDANASVKNARIGLARLLRERGATARLVDLPDDLSGVNGVDDLLATKGPDFVAALFAKATLAEAEPDEWFAPIPFAEYQLPSFPVEVFPEWLRNFVAAEAHATQTPVDAAATVALSVLAACAARRYRVSLGKWEEPLNLFTVVVLPPGSRKSAVHEDLTRPLIEYERNLIELERDHIAKERTEYKILEARLERLQKEAAKAKNKQEAIKLRAEAEDVAAELANKSFPVDPQFICDDVTPETLATLLAEQGSRMALFSSEGGCFDVMAGRYSKGLNLEVYLKGHAGDDLRINRRGRSEYVRRPALTIGITVQPEVMRGLAKNEAFRGKGLLGRWLYSWPVSLIGRREVDPDGVSSEIAAAYRRRVHKLTELQPESSEKERVIELSPSAREALHDYARKIEPEMREGGALGEFTDWAAKLVGAVGRIAGLLHLAAHVDERVPPTQVSLETVQAACRIGDYYTAHARAAFAEMGASSMVEDARYILRWLKRELPYRSEAEKLFYTKREIHRGCQSRFKTVDEIEPALSLLVAHDYFREIDRAALEPKRAAGRRPSARFALNPFFLQHN
jgi:replicative DNA helicase